MSSHFSPGLGLLTRGLGLSSRSRAGPWAAVHPLPRLGTGRRQPVDVSLAPVSLSLPSRPFLSKIINEKSILRWGFTKTTQQTETLAPQPIRSHGARGFTFCPQRAVSLPRPSALASLDGPPGVGQRTCACSQSRLPAGFRRIWVFGGRRPKPGCRGDVFPMGSSFRRPGLDRRHCLPPLRSAVTPTTRNGRPGGGAQPPPERARARILRLLPVTSPGCILIALLLQSKVPIQLFMVA